MAEKLVRITETVADLVIVFVDNILIVIIVVLIELVIIISVLLPAGEPDNLFIYLFIF